MSTARTLPARTTRAHTTDDDRAHRARTNGDTMSTMTTTPPTAEHAHARAPQRIQRRRVKGWRMPEGAIYVGRGTQWGNPFIVGQAQVRMPALDGGVWEHEGRRHKLSGDRVAFHHDDFTLRPDGSKRYRVTWHQVEDATVEQCVEMYREYITGTRGPRLDYRHPDRTEAIRAELAGRDLACWCPAEQACHADVLLELANGPRA